jgi:hypothetical protein
MSEEPASFEELATPLNEFWTQTQEQFLRLLRSSLEGLCTHLAGLGPVGQFTPEQHLAVRELLDSWRVMASALGYTIHPSTWPDGLSDEPNLERSVVFRPEEPRGCCLRVKQFGLTQGDEILQPLKVSYSAGPAPIGFTELEQAVTQEPSAADLVPLLKGWRLASFEGALEHAAIDFYLQFWSQPRPEQLQELVLIVLQEGFQLVPFYPTRVQDHPSEALQLVDSTRMVSGRIREVLRPGLLDGEGHLRVPARVIAE